MSGTSSAYVRVGDSGGKITFHFCPQCGATLRYVLEGHEDRVAVPIGAFADPTFPAPRVSVHEGSRHAWVGLPETMHQET